MEARINPPVRVVLGRKPLWVDKERQRLKQHFAELKEEISFNKQKAVDELLKNAELKSGLDFMKHISQKMLEKEESLNSSQLSSVSESESEEANEVLKKQKEERDKIFQAMMDPNAPKKDNIKNERKIQEEVAQEETFESLKKTYRTNIKYVTGWGQSQDSSLLLE